MRQVWWLLILLILPSAAWPDGYMIRRESGIQVPWTDAEGQPDCATDDDIAFWARTDAGATGQWSFCKIASDVIDAGTGRILGSLIPYPEPISGTPPPGDCPSYSYLSIDTTQTGPKYKLRACDGGPGSNSKAEPWTAKFDRLTDSLGAARTCDNGQDCSIHMAATANVRLEVSGSAPNFTVTPRLIGGSPVTLQFSCLDTNQGTGVFYMRAGFGGVQGCATVDNVKNQSGHLMTHAGVITKLYCEALTDTGGASGTVTYRARINAVNTTVNCPLTPGATNGLTATCNQTGQSVAFSAGQRISIEYDPTASIDVDHQCAVEVELAYP